MKYTSSGTNIQASFNINVTPPKYQNESVKKSTIMDRHIEASSVYISPLKQKYFYFQSDKTLNSPVMQHWVSAKSNPNSKSTLKKKAKTLQNQ